MPHTTQNKEFKPMNLENLTTNQLCATWDALATAQAEGTHSNQESHDEIEQLIQEIITIIHDRFPFESATEVLSRLNPYLEANGFSYR